MFNSHAREASSTCFASSQGVNLTDLQRSTRKMSAKSTASKSHTWTSRSQSPNLRCPAEKLCSSLTVEIRWISHDNQRRFLQLSSGHVKTHWASNLFLGACKTWKTRGRLLRGEGCFSVVQLLSSKWYRRSFWLKCSDTDYDVLTVYMYSNWFDWIRWSWFWFGISLHTK